MSQFSDQAIAIIIAIVILLFAFLAALVSLFALGYLTSGTF